MDEEAWKAGLAGSDLIERLQNHRAFAFGLALEQVLQAPEITCRASESIQPVA